MCQAFAAALIIYGVKFSRAYIKAPFIPDQNLQHQRNSLLPAISSARGKYYNHKLGDLHSFWASENIISMLY
jgi:hypothetical protein